MGALYLSELDQAMEANGLFYARFMDDWVILSPSRWKLRKAIAIVNQLLEKLKVKQHPRKTFIGRISRGFARGELRLVRDHGGRRCCARLQ